MTIHNDKIRIAIDCDDVVADWRGYARAFFKHELPPGERLPDDQWSELVRDQRMYAKLQLKDGAIELVEWCKNYIEKVDGEIFFLTAIPRKNNFPYAIQDKVHWCDKHFPGIPVFFGPRSEDKQNYVKGYNSILIDDRADNCKQWIEAGGRAHQYKNWEDCKDWLEKEL